MVRVMPQKMAKAKLVKRNARLLQMKKKFPHTIWGREGYGEKNPKIVILKASRSDQAFIDRIQRRQAYPTRRKERQHNGE